MKSIVKLISVVTISILSLGSTVLAACVGPDQTAVQNAISAATYGDTIEVCSGSATWSATSQGCTGNSMLCIKKGIVLRGATGGTNIKLSGSAPYGAICYEPDATSISNDTPFEFTRFIIDSDNVRYPEGMLDVRNSGTAVISKVNIHDNVFKNNSSEVIVINGPVYGVAYSNTFIDCETVIKVEGGNSRSWDLGHREYGTKNNFFFEDNISTCTTAKSCGAFTAGQGGSLVVRYNTTDLGKQLLDGNQWHDLHGLQSMTDKSGGVQCGYSPFNVADSCQPMVKSCSEWSQVKTEWYGNIYTNFYNPYSTPQEWMRHRGSWMLMFNNSISGTGHMPLPDIYQYSCDSCASSGSYSQHVQNTYVWNNIGQNEGNRPIYVLQDNCKSYATGSPYAITENVDFWNYNASCTASSCTAGIGVGPTVPAGTCTTGVGYWVTNYSAPTSPPGTLADMKTYTQAGVLYKCTATNVWTPYYRPYTYPHPLRTKTLAPPVLTIKQ